MMLVAYWQPAIGASEGNLNIKYISEILVIIIFLFQGSRLKIENLSLLLQRPVGSLVLQAGIIFLPVLWVKIGWALGLVSQALYGPLFFSAILPTTIASCVVFSRNAGGNADYALGHATLSNLLGILLVPFLWFGSFANGGAFGFLFLKIFALVMAPCFVGWVLTRIFPVLKEITSKEWYGQVPMLGIAFLVYLSMCDGLYSTDKEIFLLMLRDVFPSCLALVLLLHLSGWVFSMRWSKNREIQVSQFFCLSQKSLAMGLPIASVLFSESQQELFSITLPLFCIHFFQLLIGTLFLKPCKSQIEAGEKAN
jgi:sodium/bile acid cotransporter 7